jgi:hypothetical protein
MAVTFFLGKGRIQFFIQGNASSATRMCGVLLDHVEILVLEVVTCNYKAYSLKYAEKVFLSWNLSMELT